MTTQLTFEGPADLLRKLQGGKLAPFQFMPIGNEPDDGCLSVPIHHELLGHMNNSDTYEEFEVFVESMGLLLDLQLLETKGTDNDSARLFVMTNWGVDADTFEVLMRRFIDLGYLRVNEPISGDLDMANIDDDQRSAYGMTPMAAAIHFGSLEQIRVLDSCGADNNIGPVVRGGPARQAAEYAYERREVGYEPQSGEISAYFAEKTMNELISSASLSAPLVATAPARRQRLV